MVHCKRAIELGSKRPDIPADLQELERDKRRKAGKKGRTVSSVRYPDRQSDFADLSNVLNQYLRPPALTCDALLRASSKVFTQGSCFASNIYRVLRSQGIHVTQVIQPENYNTTFSNAALMSWLAEGAHDANTRIIQENLGEENREIFLRELRDADIFIFTAGVAPAFFDKRSGDHIVPGKSTASVARLVRTADFRTTTVEENKKQLTDIVASIRSVNADCAIVMTVSPIPLSVTFEMSSAIIADSVSKSVLRAAVHEFIAETDDEIHYWPSFEMIKWVSPHHGPLFGNDDGSSRHADWSVLNLIFASFIDHFSKGTIAIR